MRKFAAISPKIWGSRKWRKLDRDDKARLLYLYLHTCPHATSIGAFRLPIGYAAADLRWEVAHVEAAFSTLADAQLIDYDVDDEIVRIIDFLTHSPPTNPKHAGAALALARELPYGMIRDTVIAEVLESPHAPDTPMDRAMDTPTDSPMHSPIDSPIHTPIDRAMHTRARTRDPETEPEPETEPDTEPDTEIPVLPTPRGPSNSLSKEISLKTDLSDSRKAANPTERVFEHWCLRFQHPRAKLDEKRKRCIKRAMKAGYDEVQLIEAIDGAAKTPHNCGINDRGQVYDAITLILRDGDQIDRFIRNCHNPPEMPQRGKIETPGQRRSRANAAAAAAVIRKFEQEKNQ